MIREIIKRASKVLPLKIKGINWDSPSLNIFGEDWGFFTMEPWRLISPDKMITGSEDDEKSINEALTGLVKQEIIALDFQSKNIATDLAFIFKNSYLLEVFSVSGYEPWTLTFSSENITYVASPKDPNCVDSVPHIT